MNSLSTVIFLSLGAAAGLLHYTAIAHDAADLVRRGAAIPILCRRLGRLALTGGLFLLAARSGLHVLAAAAVGFFVLRQSVIARYGTA